jgi:hypothetical protein
LPENGVVPTERPGALKLSIVEQSRFLVFETRRRCFLDQKPYPAEKARGGETILNTPGRRAIFLTGLIGAVVLSSW